ncbi:MAG: transcription-repair coupling factor [Defluviitaleaceae bacterium]|nr:transcription-repair coupling factor [Defluviitaleaceae bacterium]
MKRLDKTEFLKPLEQIESFNQVLGLLNKNDNVVALCTGVVDGQKSHLAWAFAQAAGSRPYIMLTHSEIRAKEIARDLAFFEGEAAYFPALDFMAKYVDVASKDVICERLAVLSQLSFPLVATMEALLSPLSLPDDFVAAVITLAEGDEVGLTQLAEKLVHIGYERAEQVEGHGQFAIRGGILDIFVPTAPNPFRVEFWGDEVDSIRIIDPLTQRSLDAEKLRKIEILPMKEHLGCDKIATLFDYLPSDAIIFIDEVNRSAVRLDEIKAEHTLFLQDLLEKKRIAADECKIDVDYATIVKAAEGFDVVLMNLMAHNVRDFKPKAIAHFEGKTATSFAGRFDLLCEDLSYLSTQNYQIFVLAGNDTKVLRLRNDLAEEGIPLANINIITGEISDGFEYPQIRLALMNFADSVEGGTKKRKTRRPQRKKGQTIDHFTDLNVGDYVVHDAQGIGIYRGLERIQIDGFFRDYLKISYRGEANLYVATNQMDVLQKYIGGENAKPQLSKLGGDAWAKTKARVRGEVEEVARELVELYAKREATRGHIFEQDTVWQTEFEDAFIYDETDDQLTAVEDVKRDMEHWRVMDRLVCGDVGYGKTEVAIRAAFKAVNDQKQVAFLCPTTILAQQHYNTFVQRMKDYPVNIQVVSRFRSAKETKQILDDVALGKVDILIGTHRLLSKDVNFKDLGLIVIDEEQRFGVMHKEKLKQNWANVDVLTLTATPIPRTLHMSLAGIRDMSILNEPPQQRQPIQTYVLEYSPEMVRNAIMREMGRGGQVYYLHNRVQNIADTANKVQKLVPDAVVAYAHGRMNETELENVMMDFIDGEIDVLVCTTIVESGLDIPNVNTIIIQDSDRLGLAQLYQLRGRVGRAGRSSFAYLMYQKDKILTEVAEKRLQTIREFTEFGAGFKIAMRDLEIRGAGNMLGTSQHGHMDAVGYEMYCKLLDLAVRELRGMEAPNDFETTIDLQIDAFIPPQYIPHENTRLEIYKKISHTQNLADYYDIQEEMEDRFGTLPPSAQNLLDIALLKARANAIDITAVKQNQYSVTLAFKVDAKADPVHIAQVVQKSKGRLKFTLSSAPFLTLKIYENDDVIGMVSDVLLQLSEGYCSPN